MLSNPAIGVQPYYFPVNIAIDSAGNLYIADSWNSQICKSAPEGTTNIVAGAGTLGFSGDGDARRQARCEQAAHDQADGKVGGILVANPVAALSETNLNSRLEGFCDGVFSIALTLLIIDIKIPPSVRIENARDFWLALRGITPSILAFLLSFIVILITRVNHHASW